MSISRNHFHCVKRIVSNYFFPECKEPAIVVERDIPINFNAGDGRKVYHIEEMVSVDFISRESHDAVYLLLPEWMFDEFDKTELLVGSMLQLLSNLGSFVIDLSPAEREFLVLERFLSRLKLFFTHILGFIKKNDALELCAIEDADILHGYGKRHPYPMLSGNEEIAWRLYLIGKVESALSEIETSPQGKATTPNGLRLWNRLILDRRESIQKIKNNGSCLKRILGIWDLRFTPFTYGDFLYFLAVLKMIGSENKIKKIQILVLWPPAALTRYNVSFSVNYQNGYINDLESLWEGYLDGAKGRIFNDVSQFEECILEMSETSILVPRFASKIGGMYASYVHSFRFCANFYKNSNERPWLVASNAIKNRANALINSIKETKEKLSISIHVRCREYDQTRNTDLDALNELFQWCKHKAVTIHFIILGISRNGAPKEWCQNNDISFSNDFTRNAAEEFALISSSDGYIGGPSGPSTIAILNNKPYLLYNYKVINEHPYLQAPDPFPWARRHQVVHWEGDSNERLLSKVIEWISSTWKLPYH